MSSLTTASIESSQNFNSEFPVKNPTHKADKSYHHGDLKKTLIRTACRRIDDEGTEKLSLRALAREAGVSPTAPYRHFSTKSSLLAAIATEGYLELLNYLDKYIAESGDDIIDQITAGARAYIDFALAEPTKFNLMFGGVVADFSPYVDLQNIANTTFNRFFSIVLLAQKSGKIAPGPIEEINAYLWSGIHGAASLLVNRKQQSNDKETTNGQKSIQCLREQLDKIIERLVNGLLK
ncbi:hypothetical protein NBRC116493_18870 [Aurantivibrio infirmus]